MLPASMETRELLNALCTLLIDIGVVSEQRLVAEANRQSFAAARRTHPCDWNTSLLCLFQSRDVASKIASGFSDRKECAGLLTASRAFATSVSEVASALPRSKVLIWGRKADASTQAVDIFDPFSTTLISLPVAEQWRAGSATAVINGFFYVCGGYSVIGRPTPNLSCFDPLRAIWRTLPPMSEARLLHVAVVIGARLYVCGGWNSGSLDSAECFDTRSNTWSPFPTMRRSRSEALVAVIMSHVYIVGGAEDYHDFSLERLPPTGNWQTLPDMNVGRIDFSTAVVADKLYVCGGTMKAPWNVSTLTWEFGNYYSRCSKIVDVPLSPSCAASFTCVEGTTATRTRRQWSASTQHATHGSDSRP